jgi:hypothetical protein
MKISLRTLQPIKRPCPCKRCNRQEPGLFQLLAHEDNTDDEGAKSSFLKT